MERTIIWNDNRNTDNYQLYFDQEDTELAPDSITLTAKDDDKNNPPIKWEFEIVSRDYIDTADEYLQVQIDDINLQVETIKAKDVEQDERLDAIELKNVEQDDRLDAIDGLNGQQTGRLDLIEQKNVEQDERLDNIDEKNADQDETLREHSDNISALNTQVADIKNEISDDVCKLVETSAPYTVADFPIGIYRVHANLRVHLQTQVIAIPVMGIMTVSIDSAVKETYFNLTKSEITTGNVADVNVSYFNGNIDMSALINRYALSQGFVRLDLTDFTYDSIKVTSPSSAEYSMIQYGGDSGLDVKDAFVRLVDNGWPSGMTVVQEPIVTITRHGRMAIVQIAIVINCDKGYIHQSDLFIGAMTEYYWPYTGEYRTLYGIPGSAWMDGANATPTSPTITPILTHWSGGVNLKFTDGLNNSGFTMEGRYVITCSFNYLLRA